MDIDDIENIDDADHPMHEEEEALEIDDNGNVV